MSFATPPHGITPLSPGLDREEPTFVSEDDIPTDGDSHEPDLLGQNEGDANR